MPTEGLIRGQASEYHVGIGDRRRRTPLPVAGRSRAGARGGRSHLQGSAVIQAGNGTPAGANGVHGQHGHGHGVGAYAAFLGQLGRPVD